MKYRAFIAAIVVFAVALVGLAGFGIYRSVASRQSAAASTLPSSADSEAPASVQPGSQPDAGQQPPPSQNAPASRPTLASAIGMTEPLSDAEKEILGQQQSPLTNGEPSGDTRKWQILEPGFRAEFRADTGKGAKFWNRAKVGYTGDRGFSERWDFKPDGSVKRRVAPDGGEDYTQEYQLKDGAWVRTK